ncbi:nucleotidyltransferase family protein [bacterium]|nr:nucleotidyltransferase family protein [bacterium]
MKTLEEIKKILKKELPYLKEKYRIKKIGIFGSYVRGENKKNSDLDLLVEFSQPIGLFKQSELELYLTKKLNMEIDLVPKKALKPFIIQNILREIKYL